MSVVSFNWVASIAVNLPQIIRWTKKNSPAEVKIPIKMCFCECKWKMFRQMEQHRGSTSPCCSCRAKSVQHSWNDRKDDEPLNHFSSHKEKKPQNPVSADWLLLFPLGCRAAEANRFRRDESGKTAALIPQTGKTINLPCFLHDVDCTDQKLGYGEPLWNFDAIILSVTHRFFVSMPGSDASCFASWSSGSKSSWSFSKSICVVNQWGKRDCVCFISCQTYISVIKLELILFIRIILDIYSNAKIFFTEVTVFVWADCSFNGAYYTIIIYSSSIFFLLDSWRAPLHDSQLKIILVQHFSSCSVWNKPFQLSSNN